MRIATQILGRDVLKIRVDGDLFNAFNFANMGFIPAVIYPNNPAFIYGLGVLLMGNPLP